MVNENKTVDKEEMKQILNHINSWINNCDTKASIMLGVIGVIASLLLNFDYIDTIYKIIMKLSEILNFLSCISLLVFGISVFMIIKGIVLLIKVLIAQTDIKSNNKDELVEDSLLFFSSIAENKSASAYKKKLYSYSEKNWIDDLVSQIYICSIICKIKFQNYKKGLLCTCVGIGILFCWICANYFVLK